MQNQNYLHDSIYATAIADALGQVTQFQGNRLNSSDPLIQTMMPGDLGTIAGTWSDDTSLTLATLAALSQPMTLATEQLEDTMQNFAAWLNNGRFTTTGVAFDVGAGTQDALTQYQVTDDLFHSGSSHERNNGNGALMRMLPVALYVIRQGQGHPFDHPELVDLVINLAQLTHRHPRSTVACLIYVSLATQLLADQPRTVATVNQAVANVAHFIHERPRLNDQLPFFTDLTTPDFANHSTETLNTSGYVVSTLITACWLLIQPLNLAQLVVAGVNLGGDSDTITSIAAGLMALQIDLASFPEQWLSQLQGRSLIDQLLAKAAASNHF
ncbi:ADP-ribosylglycohydrolase family protein [Furfurilactobacillus curtus]|uniref:ADP-ribosylglycohydrolase n=1 Tax=Furfurilactobacillus curtus TaxID=1746200 RepID=A0ABQ5JPN7_9LACO